MTLHDRLSPQPSQIMGQDIIAITGSFVHNSKTYTYQAEARPKSEPTDQEMADFRIAIGGTAPQTRSNSLLDLLFVTSPMCVNDCRAAINTIADWLERESKGSLGSVKHFAKRMRMEADQ